MAIDQLFDEMAWVTIALSRVLRARLRAEQAYSVLSATVVFGNSIGDCM